MPRTLPLQTKRLRRKKIDDSGLNDKYYTLETPLFLQFQLQSHHAALLHRRFVVCNFLNRRRGEVPSVCIYRLHRRGKDRRYHQRLRLSRPVTAGILLRTGPPWKLRLVCLLGNRLWKRRRFRFLQGGSLLHRDNVRRRRQQRAECHDEVHLRACKVLDVENLF